MSWRPGCCESFRELLREEVCHIHYGDEYSRDDQLVRGYELAERERLEAMGFLDGMCLEFETSTGIHAQ